MESGSLQLAPPKHSGHRFRKYSLGLVKVSGPPDFVFVSDDNESTEDLQQSSIH
jgi:hypothetical protein